MTDAPDARSPRVVPLSRRRRDGLGFLRSSVALCLLAAALPAAGVPAAAQTPVNATALAGSVAVSTGFRQAVAEASADNEALATFYRARNYEPIWTTGADAPRRAALFRALDHAGDQGLPASRYDAAGVRAAFADVTSERARGQLEVRLSRLLLTFASDLRNGALIPAKIDAGIVRDVQRADPLATLTTFAASDPARFFRALVPHAPEYAQLTRARIELARQIRSGGWGAPVPTATLHPGDGGAAVIALRDRLVAMDYLRPTASPVFDGPMQKAVQLFQIDHGLTADGVANESTLAEVNIPPEDRLASVLVAMERLRWMNGLDLGARHIWVNLPDFTAKIIDDGKVTFETVVVVGQDDPDRRSPEFSDQMELMVINPTWSVPRSITVKEYLPMLKKNPNAAGHLRIVDRQGRAIDRQAVDFTQYTERNFPFSMSQPPSDGNALGKVKFLFPNKWNIYLHDTPSKSLFDREVRAFSHGCIRVGRPFDLAYALLAPQSDDPQALFAKYLNSGAETPLQLDTPVPVHLVYFTAWPDARGQIEYRRDVYGRDKRIYDALIAAGVEPGDVQG